MIFIRGCPRALFSALVALFLVFLFILLHQSKRLYDDHQKYLRLQSYKQYMEEVSASMQQAEKDANAGISQLETLNHALQMSFLNGSSTKSAR